jgi:hypothetical protein
MSALAKGDHVLISAPGHRTNGKTGTVKDGPGLFLGTYLVTVEGSDYGFTPHELTKLIIEGSDSRPLKGTP